MPRLLYNLLLYLALPLLLARLLWRARRQPQYLRHVGERFGWGLPPVAGPCIWVHAVSVGETRAAEPLIRALQARHPGHRILLTHMTPTGRETGAALFGDSVTQCYLPYDHPGAVARFFRHYRPDAGVLIETEVWPNLIRAGRTSGVPLYLVNARLSERSQRGYRRVGALACEALRGFTAIAAQGAADAQRLRELGAREVTVTGNLKFDVEPAPEQVAQGAALRLSVAPRPVILAASTRDGEEELLLDAVRGHGLGAVLLVIVPRHPQRFDTVAALVAARGLHLQRRSAGGAVARETQVLLGDSMGEMPLYYAACDVALIGGSFLPYGAQNLIEPAALGTPVVIGPSVYNFAEAARTALEAGAAVAAADMAEGVRLAADIAADAGRCRAMGEAGQDFTAAHRGATGRILEMIRLNGAERSRP